LKFDKAQGAWTLAQSDLHTDPAAYPGFMLVNADVPTTGLTKTDAKNYGAFLTFAAHTGQVVGTGNGQLPDGYLPLTAANHLGTQADYTARAAKDVAAQTGVVTPLVPVTPQPPASTSSTAPPAGGTTPPPVGGTLPPTGPSTTPTTAPSTAPSTTSAAPAAQHTVISTQKTGLGAAGWVLPVLLAAGVLGGLLAGGSTVRPRRRR